MNFVFIDSQTFSGLVTTAITIFFTVHNFYFAISPPPPLSPQKSAAINVTNLWSERVINLLRWSSLQLPVALLSVAVNIQISSGISISVDASLAESLGFWIMQVSSIVSPLSTFAFLHITRESNGYRNYVISSDIRSKHIAVLLISFTAKGRLIYVTLWKN